MASRARVGVTSLNVLVIHSVCIFIFIQGVVHTQARMGPDNSEKVDLAAQKTQWTHHSEQCTYTIVTHTGNIENAGTNADVNLEIYNKKGERALFAGLTSGQEDFEPGQTDTFTMVDNCIFGICKIHLSHDNAGVNASWFVNSVSISVDFEVIVFDIYEWLAKDEPPYTLSYTNSQC